MSSNHYVNSKIARETLGVCNKTLRNMADSGKLDHIRINGGWRKYNVAKFLNRDSSSVKKSICYARVSTHEQKYDLITQISTLKQLYPNYEIIKDIGSGINFKRKGLQKIIHMAINNEISEVIVTYKDRLCRIGFDLIEMILHKYSNAKITVVNAENKQPSETITEDLIEIITVYSSKIHGLRSEKSKEKRKNKL